MRLIGAFVLNIGAFSMAIFAKYDYIIYVKGEYK